MESKENMDINADAQLPLASYAPSSYTEYPKFKKYQDGMI